MLHLYINHVVHNLNHRSPPRWDRNSIENSCKLNNQTLNKEPTPITSVFSHRLMFHSPAPKWCNLSHTEVPTFYGSLKLLKTVSSCSSSEAGKFIFTTNTPSLYHTTKHFIIKYLFWISISYKNPFSLIMNSRSCKN